MTSERVDTLLDDLFTQVGFQIESENWSHALNLIGAILEVDPDNEDAKEFLKVIRYMQKQE